ncbi:MAG TPA: phosphate acyltransferase PlsX [Bryobacterales bacterium]|nr:phosphate acyltransferase PlsX [Bryobacterales bacterium]
MYTVAVDAMGGDAAPRVEVEGAILAARSYPVKVLLVGRQEILRRELAEHLADHVPIEIVNATEVITMDEAAAKAVRAKRDSSIRVAARLVRDGRAQGLVSAGNTGAVMACAKIVLGTLPGLHRPALASVFPTLKGTAAVLIDVGANVDSSPQMLAQFAVMGEAYSRVICRQERPRVGLLSIGEEEHKGNDLTRRAYPLLKELPIHFIGNVEGRDIYSGEADVIVCDGFIGNVALKVSEGMVETIKFMLQDSLTATVTRKMGYLLARTAFDDFKARVDYSEYGGAPLLGLKGVCIICHGRSNPNAIKNAIRIAMEFSKGRVNETIETALRGRTSEKVTAIGD